MNIKVLPAEISNQIAAGEVVERPASVVKECVENALDAKAQNIEIYLNEGGKTLIKITDDGIGMTPEDLPKAILRHATSKISSTEDLFHLNQYGFRGEALAAVSSISNFNLLSRAKNAEHAYQITGESGHFTEVVTASGNEGTSVTVEKLFAPTPARLEYLKSDEAEYRACMKEVYGFALANPEVSFKLFKNDKLSLDYPSTTLDGRVAQVLKRLSTDLCPVEFKTRNLDVVGFVSTPGSGLSNRNQQYLLVNGRRIEDHRLAYAVREAYVQTCGIEKHLHPAFVLHLNVDPILVDVNVHPRKLEVKFAEPGEVFSAVKKAVMLGLEKLSYRDTPLSSEPHLSTTASAPPASFNFKSQTKAPQISATSRPSFATRHQNLDFTAETNLSAAPEISKSAEITLIGQADNKYIVAQTSEGIYFFDQHALHERQRFEDFWQTYKAAPITSQPLLVPEAVNLGETDVSLIAEHQDVLNKLGFVLEIKQDDQIEVLEVPEIIVGQDLTRIMGLCVTFLQNEKLGENVLDQIMRKLLEYKACRGAVMFGDRLEREEMEKLIQDFDSTDWKLLCPHGRPNHHFVPFADLDKIFHR